MTDVFFTLSFVTKQTNYFISHRQTGDNTGKITCFNCLQSMFMLIVNRVTQLRTAKNTR